MAAIEHHPHFPHPVPQQGREANGRIGSMGAIPVPAQWDEPPPVTRNYTPMWEISPRVGRLALILTAASVVAVASVIIVPTLGVSAVFSELIVECIAYFYTVSLAALLGLYKGGNRFIAFEGLENNPTWYLRQYSIEGLPDRFVVTGSNVVDAGGVSKHVITKLMSALIAQGKIVLSGSKLPFATPAQAENMNVHLRHCAKLCSHLHNPGGDRLVIGNIFSPLFMRLVEAVDTTPDPVERRRCIATLLQDDLSAGMAAKVVLRVAGADVDYAAVLMCEPHEAREEAYKTIDAYVSSAVAFHTGMSESLRETMREIDHVAFTELVQGRPITRESVLEALNTEGVSPEYVAWLREKIGEAEEDWLRRFLFTVTANESITPGMTINIREGVARENGNGVEIHSCFNSIAFPHNLSREEFLGALDAALIGEGYEIG